jgi:hypothetical protein
MGKRLKSFVFILASSAILEFAGCSGMGPTGSSPIRTPSPDPDPTPISAPNQWTWVSGSNTVNQQGSYGTLGVPAPGNIPGSRDSAMSWTDAAGNLWFFGGEGFGSNGGGFFNDLWKFSGGEWTWMGGSSVGGQPGTYGTLGTPAAGNVPGGRVNAATWTDAHGNLWLFGGFAVESGTAGYFNDLWEYQM